MSSDKKRQAGLLATMRREGGKVRLVLTDAVAEPGSESWNARHLFTHVDFDATTFQSGQLSEADLASIGLNVVTRLSALAKA